MLKITTISYGNLILPLKSMHDEKLSNNGQYHCVIVSVQMKNSLNLLCIQLLACRFKFKISNNLKTIGINNSHFRHN